MKTIWNVFSSLMISIHTLHVICLCYFYMLYKYVGDNNIYTFIAWNIQQQFSVGKIYTVPRTVNNFVKYLTFQMLKPLLFCFIFLWYRFSLRFLHSLFGNVRLGSPEINAGGFLRSCTSRYCPCPRLLPPSAVEGFCPGCTPEFCPRWPKVGWL